MRTSLRIRRLLRPLRRRPLLVLLSCAAGLTLPISGVAAQAGLYMVTPRNTAFDVTLLPGIAADYSAWPVRGERQAELDPAVIAAAARDEILRRVQPHTTNDDLVPLDLPPRPQAALPPDAMQAREPTTGATSAPSAMATRATTRPRRAGLERHRRNLVAHLQAAGVRRLRREPPDRLVYPDRARHKRH
ncbi:MAG: hypothetical protein HGA65_16275, partial [Oscillochloris sp.]|nr:hypothetical protein [Oscillochloris sp.]